MLKIFLASRPIGILQKNNAQEFFRSKFLSIRLQDQTKADIARFADSFLKYLEFSSFLKQATEYIVENAQGVFLWVQLVKREMLAYDEAGRCAEKDIFEFLKSLPTELEELYQSMLSKMGRNRADIRDGIRMFQLVLFARRPLSAKELLHALAIPGERGAEFTISNDSFRNSIPPERRITHCGGNFLEIRQSLDTTTYENSTTSEITKAAGSGSVQVMHQTVREFFLRSDGFATTSDFRMNERDAHICISITCIRYLRLCASNMAERLPGVDSWTSQHLKDCAQCLHEMPFVTYALSYLSHHIDGCQKDAYVLDITSQFIDELVNTPAAYLLENWVASHLNNAFLKTNLRGVGTDFRNRTLYTALREGYPIAAEVSLIVGADANLKDDYTRTPLYYAAENGYPSGAKLLLERGADLESTDSYSRTPLSRAAENGHAAAVKLLLKSGANLKSLDSEGRTPLIHAVANGHKAVVRLLLKRGANLRSKNRYSQTLLHFASINGHAAVVKLLLERGADLEPTDNYGRTPLSWVAENGHAAVVKLLVKSGADPESKDNYKQTALLWAARKGHEAVVRLLLDGGANLESDDDHLTPLSWAAGRGHEVLVRLLLERGANLEFKDVLGQTPLSWAAESGHEAVVKLLLEKGADPESQDSSGLTPLSWAIEKGHEEVVMLLLGIGADLESKDGEQGDGISLSLASS